MNESKCKPVEIVSPTKKSLSSDLKKDTKPVFDLVDSTDLKNLKRKREQLSARISAIERNNEILQKELVSAINAKSELDFKNHNLHTEVSSLKRKLNFFSNKQKYFHDQSDRVKDILTKLTLDKKENDKLAATSPSPESLTSPVPANLSKDFTLPSSPFLSKSMKLKKNKYKTETKYRQKIKRYQEELKIVKINCENLRKVLSQQDEGFQISFNQFQNRNRKLIKEIELKKSENQEVEKRYESIRKFLEDQENLHKEELNNVSLNLKKQQDLRKQAEEELTEVKLEYKNQDHQNKIQQNQITEKLKKDFSIKELRQAEEIEKLKSDYENKITNIKEAFQKKMKHISFELENELCSEKRKSDIITKNKDQEIKNLKENIRILSDQLHQAKLAQTSQKTHFEDLSKQYKVQALDLQKSQERCVKLKQMWSHLQHELEKNEQQILALRELNQSLSMELSNEKPSSKLKQVESSNFQSKTEEAAESILADIHFDS